MDEEIFDFEDIRDPSQEDIFDIPDASVISLEELTRRAYEVHQTSADTAILVPKKPKRRTTPLTYKEYMERQAMCGKRYALFEHYSCITYPTEKHEGLSCVLHTFRVPITCGDRFHPECAKRISYRQAKKYISLLLQMENPQMYVITRPYYDDPVAGVLDMHARFSKLRRRKIWKKLGAGERSFNMYEIVGKRKGTKTLYYVHIHWILDLPVLTSEEMTQLNNIIREVFDTKWVRVGRLYCRIYGKRYLLKEAYKLYLENGCDWEIGEQVGEATKEIFKYLHKRLKHIDDITRYKLYKAFYRRRTVFVYGYSLKRDDPSVYKILDTLCLTRHEDDERAVLRVRRRLYCQICKNLLELYREAITKTLLIRKQNDRYILASLRKWKFVFTEDELKGRYASGLPPPIDWSYQRLRWLEGCRDLIRELMRQYPDYWHFYLAFWVGRWHDWIDLFDLDADT